MITSIGGTSIACKIKLTFDTNLQFDFRAIQIYNLRLKNKNEQQILLDINHHLILLVILMISQTIIHSTEYTHCERNI